MIPRATGIDMTVALGITAAIGEISRFSSPGKLVSYFGLNPSVSHPAYRLPSMAASPSRAGPMPVPCW